MVPTNATAGSAGTGWELERCKRKTKNNITNERTNERTADPTRGSDVEAPDSITVRRKTIAPVNVPPVP
jgi:hypothetical protein